jgi:cell division protein FtsI/penicillin-binding protein 2
LSGRVANRRIRLLLAVFAIVFGATLARAVWLQGVRAQSLGRMAASQHRTTIDLAANRGTIYDSTGVQLAVGEQAITVYADPLQVQDPTKAAPVVARALRLPAKQVYEKLADRAHGFVYVQRKADATRAQRLQRLHIPGIGFYPEERRYYPQHGIAAQVLGYAGVDNHGLSGLELALDKPLAGRPGRETLVRDPLGHVLDSIVSRPALNGSDVTLTIDHNIQGAADQVLRQTVQKWHAKDGTAIVLDPHTGAVLAMAVAPGYDANNFPAVPKDVQRNRAVTDTYEPGSTFKLVTVGGALSSELVTPQERFTLPYSIQVADRRIHDAELRGTETMSVAQILAKSSNVGAITLAELLGKQRLMSWISRFGFGRQTGIDFPGESQGIVLPADQWSGSTIGNVPIGQGIAVTPMQMASAYAAIANRGIWTRPHLVERVGDGLDRARADLDAPERRPRRHRDARADSRLPRCRQDRHGGQAGSSGWLLELEVRRLVCRVRTGYAAADRRARGGRRAAGRDLGRRRGRTGFQGDRAADAAVPLRTAGRPGAGCLYFGALTLKNEE